MPYIVLLNAKKEKMFSIVGAFIDRKMALHMMYTNVEMMKIFIKPLRGEKIALDVEPTDTIREIYSLDVNKDEDEIITISKPSFIICFINLPDA